jgi:protein-S-isoprenylcysteine O-methyltransferase Ste14
MFFVWIIGRIGNKKTLKKHNKFILTTLLLYLSYLILFLPYSSKVLPMQITPNDRIFGPLGVVLCFLGAVFAIWSRYVLGKNWSGVIATEKENHELVTTGPYAIVRHPIYLGFIIAMLGFALTVGNIISFVAVILGLITLILRISIEEKLMNGIFVGSYKEYSSKTKRLIPFIW